MDYSVLPFYRNVRNTSDSVTEFAMVYATIRWSIDAVAVPELFEQLC